MTTLNISSALVNNPPIHRQTQGQCIFSWLVFVVHLALIEVLHTANYLAVCRTQRIVAKLELSEGRFCELSPCAEMPAYPACQFCRATVVLLPKKMATYTNVQLNLQQISSKSDRLLEPNHFNLESPYVKPSGAQSGLIKMRFNINKTPI